MARIRNASSMPKEFLENGANPHAHPGVGKYANYFQVGQNELEFIIDFGQSFSDGREEHFHTRIVTSPRYAKELLRILRDSIDGHEARFGEIPEK